MISVPRKYKVTDKVRYDAGSGSYGKVVKVHENWGGWPDSERYDVQWEYGRDVRGEMMTGYSRNLEPIELHLVSDEEYAKNTDRDGWGK